MSHAVTLLKALEEAPHGFSFFEALRRLECMYPDKPRMGQSQRLADDPIRLAQQPSLAFAPSTLASFEPGQNGRPPRLEVLFLGLFGPNGPLPLHLTEYARDRLRNAGDPTFERFLDLFHHRMLGLFYRAWASAQPTVSFDRPASDRFGVYLASLCGLGLLPLRHRDAMPDRAKLHYAGQLAGQTRHPEGLRAILAGFFKLPVAIAEFIGEWLALPDSSRCRLGESRETGILGVSAVVGDRVWGCQDKFRIILGPLSLADYRRLLPGGDSLPRLVAVVRNTIGEVLNWDVQLVLRKEEIPPCKLGERGQLGWSSWLASAGFEEDANDLVLSPLTSVN